MTTPEENALDAARKGSWVPGTRQVPSATHASQNRPYLGFRRRLDGEAKRSEITVFVKESDSK